mgnify:FL=1
MHFFFPVWPRLYWRKKKFFWTAALGESCKYDFDRDGMKAWNKLVGVSKSINPRKNSIRFVWRWNKDEAKFQIAVFVEYKKEFKKTVYQIGSVIPGAPFTIGFDFDGSNVVAIMNEQSIILPHVPFTGLTFRLNPYFGGQAPAPHKVQLHLAKDKNESQGIVYIHLNNMLC